MFSGVGGFENGIHRAVKRIEATGQTDIAEYCPVFNIRGIGGHKATCVGEGGENGIYRAVNLQSKTTELQMEQYIGSNNSNIVQRTADCVGFSEIDKYAIQIYEKQFKQPKSEDEIKSDLDNIKTIVLSKNYDIIELCYVNTAKLGQTFIQATNLSVKTALESIQNLSVKEIVKKLESTNGNLELCTEKKCSICMGMNVNVVEKKKDNSSHWNIKEGMDISTEKNTEQGMLIASPSDFTNRKNMKSYATTVITLKGDMVYAHIKRTKPHRNWGDATRIDEKQLPDFDLLVGGFPCQSFSIAGKRGGFQDTRGTLFFDIARILAHKRPRHFLLENVKGLLSHDSGKTFQTILKVLTDIGYFVEWQVLNSKNFGVAQNRERVFIVGHFGNRSGRKVFPIGEGNKKTLKQIIRGGQGNRVYDIKWLSTTQASQAGGQGAKTGLYAVPVLTPEREKRQQGRRMKENGDPAFTVTAQDRHGVFNGYRIRRLTPVECARLQGFPDDWHEGVSDSQAYRCYGNAVTVNVIEAIMIKLLSITELK